MGVKTVNSVSNPMTAFGIKNSTIPIYTAAATLAYVVKPTQIAGLVPLICSDIDPRLPAFSKCDCREWTNDDCYINPVFASTSDSDLLKNDKNMFLLEYPFLFSYQWGAALSVFSLEEFNGSTWITTAVLNNNLYGILYDFQSLCIKNWRGFQISWRNVLIAFGEGLYRFKSTSSLFGNSSILVSEPFCLKEWSCSGTDVTVRWETVIAGGRLGSIVNDKRVFEFCCVQDGLNGAAQQISPVTWNDQIRVYAFFGREKTEYERVQIEYQNGEVIQVRNEAIQKFEYESALQPKWVHDRLKAYALMADQLYVTDYNWNNSDYEIKKKGVVPDGSYEPEYNENTRYSNVKVQFKEAFQNVIRDKCCNVVIRTGQG